MGETFLVKIKDDQQVHRFLDHLNRKIVRFVYEDPMDGFYCLSCDDYDTQVLLQNATDTSYKINIDKRIEPGNLTIYDVRSNMKQDPRSTIKTFQISHMSQSEYNTTTAILTM